MVSLYLLSRKGYCVLDQLIHNDLHHLVDMVIVAKDLSVKDDYSLAIKNLCESKGIVCYDRNGETKNMSRYILAISWRWLIDAGKSQLIVLHDSLLPKYRGFAPLVSQLINGELRTGVTAFFATKEFDSGDIISQRSMVIAYPAKIYSVIENISKLYGEIAVEIFTKILNKEQLNSKPQDHKYATYSLWRDSDDYRIDWAKDAGLIKRFIDAVGYPYEGASTVINGVTARVLEAEVVCDVVIENRNFGKVIFFNEGRPVVVCGGGLLMLTEIVDDRGESLFPLSNFRTRFE